uniref:Uncharacterized protein n=1 Tax=Vitis vinifera TaxID=29760 RepID=F6HBP5_VITVI
MYVAHRTPWNKENCNMEKWIKVAFFRGRGHSLCTLTQENDTTIYYLLLLVCLLGSNRSYKPNPRLARVLDILFILHAEHEMNCSTAAARHLSSRTSEQGSSSTYNLH